MPLAAGRTAREVTRGQVVRLLPVRPRQQRAGRCRLDPVGDVVHAGVDGVRTGLLLVAAEATALPGSGIDGDQFELPVILPERRPAGVPLADTGRTGNLGREADGGVFDRAHLERGGVQPVGHPVVLGAAVAGDAQRFALAGRGRSYGDGGDVRDGFGQFDHHEITITSRYELDRVDHGAGRAREVRTADGDDRLVLRCAPGYLKSVFRVIGKAPSGGEHPLALDQRP